MITGKIQGKFEEFDSTCKLAFIWMSNYDVLNVQSCSSGFDIDNFLCVVIPWYNIVFISHTIEKQYYNSIIILYDQKPSHHPFIKLKPKLWPLT